MIPGTILAPPLSAHPKQPRHLLVIIGNFLQQVTESGIKKILLLEPFVLPYPADRKQWRKDLDPKIHSIRELAAEFGCDYLPFRRLIR